MIITPQKIAVKYNPPRICLIYKCNSQEFFHDFQVNTQDLKLDTDKLYAKMHIANPGYLDQIDKEQVCGLIDMIKRNSQKASKAQRLRGIVTGYRAPDIEEESYSDNEKAGVFDFAQVEKGFSSNSAGSDSDIDLQL